MASECRSGGAWPLRRRALALAVCVAPPGVEGLCASDSCDLAVALDAGPCLPGASSRLGAGPLGSGRCSGFMALPGLVIRSMVLPEAAYRGLTCGLCPQGSVIPLSPPLPVRETVGQSYRKGPVLFQPLETGVRGSVQLPASDTGKSVVLPQAAAAVSFSLSRGSSALGGSGWLWCPIPDVFP